MRFPAFLLCAFLLGQAAASAAEYAVMLNMNYSQKEWEAFSSSARKCGRTPVSIPPLELIPVGEALFARRDALAAKIARARPGWKKNDLDNAVEEIMRAGPGWRGDPEIADAFRDEIEALHRQTRALYRAEQAYGSVAEQLDDVAGQIRSLGGAIGQFAVSGHADGWNFTGESANRLSWSELDETMRRNPRVFRDTGHVLLLGCYNMTDNNRLHWTSLFPYASLIAGFGVKAPSRTQPVARAYISEVLDKACRIDEALAQAGRPLDPRWVEAQFRKLPSVTGTPSVIDYCRHIIEGQAGAGNALSCDEQWTTILAQAEAIQDTYLDLRALKKDPPKYDSAASELRAFYSALQATCPAAKAPSLKGEEEASESYRRALRENVIRLIFWWRVQKNFSTYFHHDLAGLDRALEQAGVEARVPALDGNTGRVEFVKAYNAIKEEISGRRKALARGRESADARLRLLDAAEKKLKVLNPLFFLQGESTVSSADEKTISVEETLKRDAIPFNWIEGTVLQPRSP